MAKYICDGFKYVGGLTRQHKRSFHYNRDEEKLRWHALPGGEMKGQMILTKVEEISRKQVRFHGIHDVTKEPRNFLVTFSSDCSTGLNNLKQMGVVFVPRQTAGRKRKTRKRYVRKSGRKSGRKTGKRRGRKSGTRRNKKQHNKKRKTRRRR
tara:strand:- start:117 stop:572 length:456 start_codon:yes stop_codon:yes gene_type:complete